MSVIQPQEKIVVPGCRVIRVLDKGDHMLVKAEVSQPLRQCARCGSKALWVNGYVPRVMWHTPRAKPVKVVIDNRRMECTQCGATANETIPPLSAGTRFSYDLLEQVARLSLSLSPVQTAKEVGIPVRLVSQAVRTWQENLIKRLQPLRVSICTKLNGVEGVFIADIDSGSLLAVTSWREENNPIVRGFAEHAPKEVHLDFDERLIDLARVVFGESTRLLINHSSIVRAANAAYEMTLALEIPVGCDAEQAKEAFRTSVLDACEESEEALARLWPASYSAFRAVDLVQGVLRGESCGDGWQLVADILSGLEGRAGEAFSEFLAGWEKFEMIIKPSIGEQIAHDCWIESDYQDAVAAFVAKWGSPRRGMCSVKAMARPIICRALSQFSDVGYTPRQKASSG